MESEHEVLQGVVMDVPNGFGFIGIDSVRRVNGEPHTLDTTYDIFIPQSECDTPLRAGMTVRFQARPNPKKGPYHFKAVNATEITDTALVPANGPVMDGFHWTLITKPGTDLVRDDDHPHPHSHMKAVDPETVDQAKANNPLPGIPRESQGFNILGDQAEIEQMLARYLYDLYPSLSAINMDFSVVGFNTDALDQLVVQTATEYRELSLDQQADELVEQYASFKQTRRLLNWMIEQGFLRPGTKFSPAMLGTIVKLLEQTEGSRNKELAVAAAEECTGFMLEHDLLRPSTIVPMERLPDLFMACPVWYFAVEGLHEIEGRKLIAGPTSSKASSWSSQATQKTWQDQDPSVHPAVKWFCEMFPQSIQWPHVFQMFNRRVRTLSQYKGDMIPPHILRTMRVARQHFDYVVIATPYHDVAGMDWEDLEWIRSLDPYLLGFRKELNVFFVLGRYSDTGVFPLFNELVADTVTFLRTNKTKLSGFNAVEQPYWRTRRVLNTPCTNCFPRSLLLGSHLMNVVDELTVAFNHGQLFDWLRGQWSPPRAQLETVREE